MSSPLPLLIAVLGLAASTALAQEANPSAPAAPGADGATKLPETSPAEVKPPAKKPAAAPSVADAKKPEVTTAASAKSKSNRRVTFVKRTPAPAADAAAEPEERPLTFWDRLFGRRRREATPAPTTPVATPTPKPAPRIKKPKPASTPA
ncbi:MAG: hypothetical protein WCF18_10800, partial [Chthoniobacteraceae bacterium]